MYTIAETDTFKAKAARYWSEEERLTFFSYLAQNPLQGDVIQGGQGLRKIRWKRRGTGKSSGYRVIYFNLLENGLIICADMYSKNEKENLSRQELNKLKGQK
ncbi:MAG: type II toxin-antitoxin system RelE/ParE family toxin [Neisseria sp.]|nr:type II toxin-antitoxin system RelE/ParE family toxin [Neisseria sp.]